MNNLTLSWIHNDIVADYYLCFQRVAPGGGFILENPVWIYYPNTRLNIEDMMFAHKAVIQTDDKKFYYIKNVIEYSFEDRELLPEEAMMIVLSAKLRSDYALAT